MGKNALTSHELFSLLTLFFLGGAATIGGVNEAKELSWLAIFFSAVVGLFLMKIYLKITSVISDYDAPVALKTSEKILLSAQTECVFAQKNSLFAAKKTVFRPKNVVFEAFLSCFPHKFATLIAVFMSISAIYSSVITLSIFINYTDSASILTAPRPLIAIFLAITLYFILCGNISGFGRLGAIIFPTVAIFIAVSIAATIPALSLDTTVFRALSTAEISPSPQAHGNTSSNFSPINSNVSGFSNQIGHLSTQSSGFSSQIGGSSTQNGGFSSQIGRSSTQNGGFSSQIGRLSTQDGGFSRQIGGLSTQDGGFSRQIGGLSGDAEGRNALAGLLRGALSGIILPYGEAFFAVVLLAPHVTKPRSKPCYYSVLLVSATIFLTFAKNILSLGYQSLQMHNFASLTVAGMFSLGSFFQRFEILVASVFLICCVFKAAICLLFVREVAYNLPVFRRQTEMDLGSLQCENAQNLQQPNQKSSTITHPFGYFSSGIIRQKHLLCMALCLIASLGAAFGIGNLPTLFLHLKFYKYVMGVPVIIVPLLMLLCRHFKR